MPKLTCKNAALKMLSKRSYAIKELAGKLKTQGYEPQETAEIISWLQEKDWLNDAKYAAGRTRYRAETSKWGQGRITQELKQKGVAPSIIETVLQEFTAPTQEYIEAHNFQESAENLLNRKFETLQKPEHSPDFEKSQANRKQYDKNKKRQLNFLLRRGFSMNEAIKALEKNTK